MEIRKPKRFVSEKFLAFVKTNDCAACGNPWVDAHHTKTVGAGGSDLTCIALCRACHSDIHKLGVEEFSRRHRINVANVRLRLLERFIETELG